MDRRGFFGWLWVAIGALAAACGEAAERVAGPAVRLARQGGWDKWNERRFERDLRKHGDGVYAYRLEKDGKYGDLTFGFPDMVGGRDAMSLPADDSYAVHVPADSYPKDGASDA